MGGRAFQAKGTECVEALRYKPIGTGRNRKVSVAETGCGGRSLGGQSQKALASSLLERESYPNGKLRVLSARESGSSLEVGEITLATVRRLD